MPVHHDGLRGALVTKVRVARHHRWVGRVGQVVALVEAVGLVKMNAVGKNEYAGLLADIILGLGITDEIDVVSISGAALMQTSERRRGHHTETRGTGNGRRAC